MSVLLILAIVLISVLPILALLYVTLNSDSFLGANRSFLLLIFGSMLGLIILGYFLLCKYPINIARLHKSLKEIVQGEMSDQIRLMGSEHDIGAIEDSVNTIIGQLKERVKLAEREKEIGQNLQAL